RAKGVAVGGPVGAAEGAVRRVLGATPGRVRERRLLDLHGHLEYRAGPATVLTVPARVGPELVAPEEERHAHLGDLHAPELDASRRLALAPARPAVAAGRSTAARP